jgi:hypothetical protein
MVGVDRHKKAAISLYWGEQSHGQIVHRRGMSALAAHQSAHRELPGRKAASKYGAPVIEWELDLHTHRMRGEAMSIALDKRYRLRRTIRPFAVRR